MIKLIACTLILVNINVFANPTSLLGLDWQKTTSIDSQLSYHAMSASRRGFFVMGGKDHDSLTEKTHISDKLFFSKGVNDEWLVKARMLSPRHSFTTSVVNDKIYLLGGANYDDSPVGFIEAYDINTDKWERINTLLPTPRYELSSVSYRGKIYSLGGLYLDNSGRKKVSTILEIYEPNKNEWYIRKSEMPTPRYGFSAIEYKGKIYAIGGYTSVEDNPKVSATLEVYDPIKDVWQTKANMLVNRALFSAVVINEKIYVFGGISSDQKILQNVESYDPKTDTWSVEQAIPKPIYAHTVAYNKDGIRIVGGLGCRDECALSIKPKSWLYDDSNIRLDSKTIDKYFLRLWEAEQLKPVKLSDDYEFQRRVTLDIVGRIPTTEEIYAFRKNNKREKLIDALLKSKDFSTYWSEVIAAKIFGSGYSETGHEKNTIAAFARKELDDGKTYKKIVHDILTADPKPHLGANQKDPGVFIGYYAAQLKNPKRIEDLVNNVGRAFLGTQLHCAQCHDSHIDKRTTQTDYYGLVAFFSGFSVVDGKLIDTSKIQFQPEKYSKALSPRFINGEVPNDAEPYRNAFARLMTDSDDFSLAFVNELWAKFFGLPLETPSNTIGVIPESEINPLLKKMAYQAKIEGYDLRKMIRRIANSRVYQLSSAKNLENAGALYSSQKTKPLSPLQAFYAVSTATKLDRAYLNHKLSSDEASTTRYSHGYDFIKQLFIEDMVKTADYESPNAHYEYTANISQVLKLMDVNSYIYAGSKFKKNGRLDEILKTNPSVENVIKAMYISTLSREPSASEISTSLEFIKKQKDAVEGYEKLFWSLLNTSEFFFNH